MTGVWRPGRVGLVKRLPRNADMSSFAVPVESFATSPVHTIDPGDTLPVAEQRMQSLNISSLAVVDDAGALLGVISRSDLLRIGRYRARAHRGNPLLHFPDARVGDTMTRDVVTVSVDDPVTRACELMNQRQIHRVFTTYKGALAGVFSTRDVMRAVCDQRLEKPIFEFMSSPVFGVDVRDSMAVASEYLGRAHITGVIVTENDWPVGVFTQSEALLCRELSDDTPVEEVMEPAVVCLPRETPIYRAANQALRMGVRRIIVSHQRGMVGILGGMDFVRAVS